ncbi:hypothetical protein SAMN05443248_3846 [Bradyrhizobium erythrophlei]|uniref:Uncharacterized protein n=1 Tax=Bradyrhizobium erythrophlei TaxID=1437360 RepID=A0A1M5QK50_9BRAD|nr:hypothetical protein SAMN05443248_3846 [Bradyrhizobium erythrophlei]
MMLDPLSDLRHLRNERSDWLLSALTGVLILPRFIYLPSACYSRSSAAW